MVRQRKTKCVVCKSAFTPIRSSAKYCSAACSQKAYRRRKSVRLNVRRSRKIATLQMGRDDWETPDNIFLPLNEKYGFIYDLAASDQNAKCDNFFTWDDDSLNQDWSKIDGTCWLNPPYGRQIHKWARKAAASAKDGATIVALYAARTNRDWFRNYVFNSAKEVWFLQGEIYFSLDGQPYPTQAPFPCVIAVYEPGTHGSAIIRTWDLRTGNLSHT